MPQNITLTADKHLIEAARERARRQKTSLNLVFRRWLEGYVAEESARGGYDALMAELAGVQSGGPFTRDQLNER